MTSEDVAGKSKELVRSVPKRKGPAPKYPWQEAEDLYVNGIQGPNGLFYPTVAEVSRRLNIPEKSAQTRASTYRWTHKRRDAQAEVAKRISDERAKRLVKEASDFDDNTLAAAKIGVAMVTTRLGEVAAAAATSQREIDEAKERLKMGLPVDKSELRSRIWSRELVELATALSTFQQVGMKSLGTDAQKLEISGPDGGAIETTVSVVQEMQRDDPERAMEILKALHEAKLVDLSQMFQNDEVEVEAEVIGEE